jgi:hypothetical protein
MTNHAHPDEFTALLQGRVARTFVGPSTVRGQPPGTAAKARAFASALDLSPFGTSSRREFGRLLDRVTEDMRHSLPKQARSWGLARKLVNILLRDCLYHWHLRDKYRLEKAEAFLEIPLDSITARELAAQSSQPLPRWEGVKHLQPVDSASYQVAAQDLVS